MPDALVAVYEWMVRDEREAQRRSLFDERRLEIRAAEALPGLCERGLEESEVAHPDPTAGLLGDALVQR